LLALRCATSLPLVVFPKLPYWASCRLSVGVAACWLVGVVYNGIALDLFIFCLKVVVYGVMLFSSVCGIAHDFVCLCGMNLKM
jgi:hypothetical protein